MDGNADSENKKRPCTLLYSSLHPPHHCHHHYTSSTPAPTRKGILLIISRLFIRPRPIALPNQLTYPSIYTKGRSIDPSPLDLNQGCFASCRKAPECFLFPLSLSLSSPHSQKVGKGKEKGERGNWEGELSTYLPTWMMFTYPSITYLHDPSAHQPIVIVIVIVNKEILFPSFCSYPIIRWLW